MKYLCKAATRTIYNKSVCTQNHKNKFISMNAVMMILVCMVSTKLSVAQTGKIDCENANTQTEMNLCALKDFEKADAELNKVYKNILAQLDKDSKAEANDTFLTTHYKQLKQKFIASQKIWIQLRDANAETQRLIYEGGSMMPLIYAVSKKDDTEDRIKYLNAFMEQLTGN